MDEPCSALDPTSTRVIEETMVELAREVTIVIVTHNMQQAARVSDQCAFFLASHGTPGVIVEHGDTTRCSRTRRTSAPATTSTAASGDAPGRTSARLRRAIAFALGLGLVLRDGLGWPSSARGSRTPSSAAARCRPARSSWLSSRPRSGRRRPARADLTARRPPSTGPGLRGPRPAAGIPVPAAAAYARAR